MSRGSQRPSYFPQGHTSPRIPLILPSSENFSSACSSRSTRMQTRFLGPSRYQADTCLKLHQLNYLFGIFPRLENALISKTSVPWMGWGTQSPNVILGNCSSDRVGMHRLSETGGWGMPPAEIGVPLTLCSHLPWLSPGEHWHPGPILLWVRYLGPCFSLHV